LNLFVLHLPVKGVDEERMVRELLGVVVNIK
jgi:hypothetical protein